MPYHRSIRCITIALAAMFALAAVRSAGATVSYHALDVRDGDALAAVVSEVDGRHRRTGGVVDGVALAGALALGAELGYVGSRFLAAEECEYHEANKRFIVAASETQTEVVPAFFGPARFIENGFVVEQTEGQPPA